MSHIFFNYEKDGETYWGIWSTVVDGIIVYDCTEDDLDERIEELK